MTMNGMIDDSLHGSNGFQENSKSPHISPLGSRSHARALQTLRQPPLWRTQYLDSDSTSPVYDGAYHEDGLDDYDRSLLAEPYFGDAQSKNTRRSRMTGRLSLPGHTAPADPSQLILRGKALSSLQNRSNDPALRGRSALIDQSMQSPRYSKTDSSSLSDQFASSPTHQVSQRPKPLEYTVNQAKQRRARDIRNPPFFNGRTEDSPQTINSFQSHVKYADTAEVASIANLNNVPIVQGIKLVPSTALPDRFRSVFSFPYFNAIQSRCYDTAYTTQNNLVISAPTGGGKTAILELAICRLVTILGNDQFKVVYMAPTKSLCSERQRDWQRKFSTLGLQCAELTGDTDASSLRNVQSAHIIITTPEKWDSVTRKWHDHSKLMRMVQLVLIDEVHILKDTRGATLEAVISRLKSVSNGMRFIALSATVPNSDDIALWLGKDASQSTLPAVREVFGEAFRPVRLQKHVEGLSYKGSDFGFESVCDPILPGIITKFSGRSRKPILIFCITRKSAVSTAKLLANWWTKQAAAARCWNSSARTMNLHDPELKSLVPTGVAFHHAGLELTDRSAIEKMFLERELSVICCTSTLAMGVNLPCHLVIIKNTVCYMDEGLKEYSDLEIVQMLGRAGRPQFDTTAVAVIITKQEKVAKYEKLLSGQELLESTLHLHLIEHLNAEIVLRTIVDLHTAKQWLRGTFLHVRLGKNPAHYKLEGDVMDDNLDNRVESICKRGVGLLEDADLIESDRTGSVKTTQYGDIMARYYIGFETMKLILGLGCQPKISDILSALAQADEYQDIRLRSNEKRFFKEINRHNGIKFPIKVDLAMHAHKRSLILQSELGCVDLPADEDFAKIRMQFNQEKNRLFTCVHRLIRAVIDCQIRRQDAVGVRNGLELARSLSARVWDSSPFQMKQIPQLGVVSVRRLAVAGISNVEDLEMTEASRLEMILSKRPPFGSRIVTSVQAFPKLRVLLKLMGKEIKKDKAPIVKVKVEWGFMNEKVPSTFQKRLINVCLVTERSDGELIDFRRTQSRNVGSGQEAYLSVELLQPTQTVNSHVMCDEIAGTLRTAELCPAIPAHAFPQFLTARSWTNPNGIPKLAPAISIAKAPERKNDFEDNDEFDDKDLDNFVVGSANEVPKVQFLDVDDFTRERGSRTREGSTIPKASVMLPNGKWACNHSCKSKTSCKHLCCREGLDKQPKPPRKAADAAKLANQSQTRLAPVQVSKRKQHDSKRLDAPSSQHFQPPAHQNKAHVVGEDCNSQVSAPKKVAIANKALELDLTDRNWYDMDISDSDEAPEKSIASSCRAAATDLSEQSLSSLPAIEDMLKEHETAINDLHRKPNIDSEVTYGSHGLHDKTKLLRSPHTCITDSQESTYGADASEIEDVLIGLDDSHRMKWPLADRTAGDAAAIEPHTNKLFLSTDSPEKPVQVEAKRALPESLSSPQDPKRLKREENMAEKAASNKKVDEQGDLAPQLKPGLPSWVYELDPDVIAEYQDYLEFAV